MGWFRDRDETVWGGFGVSLRQFDVVSGSVDSLGSFRVILVLTVHSSTAALLVEVSHTLL